MSKVFSLLWSRVDLGFFRASIGTTSRRPRGLSLLCRFQFFLFASKHFRSLTRGCLPGRLGGCVPDLLVDFPPTSSRTTSGDRPGPPPGRPPGPPSKNDHFSIQRNHRIGHFLARSGPAPFWDLGRPGSESTETYCRTPAPLTPATKHTVEPQCRCRL